LRFEADFLAQVIESVAHPIFVKDSDLRFVLLNSAFEQMVARTRSEMFGRTDHDFFPKQEADFFRKIDAQVFEQGRTVVIDAEQITDGSGNRHILATTKVPLVDASGRVTHLIGIISDITQVKAAQAVLQQANEDLERRVEERTRALEQAQEDLVRKERLAVLGRLAGGVAHQIRNPLGVIKNAAYVLERWIRTAPGSEGAGDASHAVEIIHDEVERANQIIKGLMEYARVRAPLRTPQNVEELVRVVLSRISVGPGITVRLAVTGAPQVVVDRDQVCAALENVVRNACDAMVHGGILTVDASVAPAAPGRGAGVYLGIEDTGPGIDPELQDRLFEPLLTTKAMGLGLGLVTARTLIEGQGGTIVCERSSGRGARFLLFLPSTGSNRPERGTSERP
jgi:PAS domain S-box-containing protein